MRYTIAGCITEYTVEDIRPYVESIKRCGFTGSKIMVVYQVTQDVVDYLQNNDWLVLQGELRQHIIIQRFMDMYAIIGQLETDVVIWTDVKDVIFQSDPSAWLDENMKGDILALSEAVTFKDDSWAVVNAGTSFPMEWQWLQYRTSYCAGVIIGKRDALAGLFANIYRWSVTTSNPEQLSDQAAYNVLINMHPYKQVVQFVKEQEGLAVHLGTTYTRGRVLPRTEDISLYEDGVFKTRDTGKVFSIVHQYDRESQVKQDMIKRYQ